MIPIGVDRPQFPPDYGISPGPEGLLDWAEVDAALASTRTYWVSTVRANGLPHITPIWGAWVGGELFIEGGADTLWATNLARSSAVSVGADQGSIQMIVRGTATHTHVLAALRSRIADGYDAKYPYRPEGEEFWSIRPGTVLAWTMDHFATSPTRFHFEEPK